MNLIRGDFDSILLGNTNDRPKVARIVRSAKEDYYLVGTINEVAPY
jgi:hypothetical protein